MKKKLNSINNTPFLACLIILLLNDFYLKTEYHNWLTGKLSDFCGLYVFVSFWRALFPDRKNIVYFTTAVLFVIWKSSYSQIFIDFFSQNFYNIYRVIDWTDLLALLVLPISYYFNPKHYINISPLPVVLITFFGFCATSIPEPTQKFEQPQYLLFRSGITDFRSSEYPNKYHVFQLDSLSVIKIEEIRIDRESILDDEFHKVQILDDLDLRFLRESEDHFRSQKKLGSYKTLRDSLIVGERNVIRLNMDSVTDHLEFTGIRLNGKFKRFTDNNKLLIEGKFNNGIEDSIWTYYNEDSTVILRKYFVNGELSRTEFFDDSTLESTTHHKTRDETVRDKYFHIAFLFILITAIVMWLFNRFKKLKNSAPLRFNDFTKIVWSLMIPFVTLFFAKYLSSYIPNSHPFDLFLILGEAFLVFLIVAPLSVVIFYVLKPRKWLDLVLFMFLFTLGIIFVEELIFLINLK